MPDLQQPTRISTNGRNIIFFLVAVTLLFFLRSLWTYPIEHGDAIQKYFWATRILESGDWSLLLHNHHTLRWTAMLPQTGLTWLLGTRYEVFYILPLLMFSLYLGLIIFSMKNILKPSQLLLLGAVLFTEPLSFQISNQLLNPSFGIFFPMAAILVLVHQGQRQYLAIVLSAALFFIAYGAHVTYLSFSAGAFLWLLLQRKLSGAFIFVGTILLLLLIETLVFNYLSDWQLNLGRLELLSGGHHVTRQINSGTGVTFKHLLLRWLDLPFPDILLCLGFISGGGWLVLQRKRGVKAPEFIECLYLVGLCFAVSVTFAVLSIDPIRPVMALKPMYLIPFLPFAAIVSIYLLSEVGPMVMGKGRSGQETTATLVVAFVVMMLPVHYLIFKDVFNAFVWKANVEYTAYSEQFRSGQLVLTGSRRSAYSLLAQFEYPVKTLRTDAAISAATPAPNVLCVDRLNQVPLYLNYANCAE